MNKSALTKHDIYNKLNGLTEQDLGDVANFIDFMRHKNKLGEKKLVQLEGILKGRDIDLSELKVFKQQAWAHVDHKVENG